MNEIDDPAHIAEVSLTDEDAICETCGKPFSFTPIIIGGRTRLLARICKACDYKYVPDKTQRSYRAPRKVRSPMADE